MKYISIDIETTGINPRTCQIIQFGAIIEDTNNPLSFEEVPKFEVLLEHDSYKGEPFALHMHKDIFKKLSDVQRLTPEQKLERGVISVYEFVEYFSNWLQLNGFKKNDRLNVAGKNFASFDWTFLKRLCDFEEKIKIRHRVIDPSILFFDPKVDEALPGLDICKERAGLKDTSVAHTALADAWDIVLLLRTKLK